MPLLSQAEKVCCTSYFDNFKTYFRIVFICVLCNLDLQNLEYLENQCVSIFFINYLYVIMLMKKDNNKLSTDQLRVKCQLFLAKQYDNLIEC